MKQKLNLTFVAFTVVLTVAVGSFGFGLGYGLGNRDSGKQTYVAEVDSTNGAQAYLAETNPTSQEIQPSQNYSDEISYVNRLAYSGTGAEGVSQIVESAADAVVSINVLTQARNYFNQVYNQKSAGSGFIIHEDENKIYIATNNHVVSGASEVKISVDDTVQVTAKTVGTDSNSDLAVLSVLKEDLKNAGIQYKISRLGDSELLKVGDCVVAIGNALGEGKTATSGIVSAKNKHIDIDGTSLSVIQTDAAINPGNSGGALVNAKGEVIGINTAKLYESGVEGMGYSIPINEAKLIIEELITNGYIPRPFFGINGVTVSKEIMNWYGLSATGVYIVAVEPKSSAQLAGVKVGDIIFEFNGAKISTSTDITTEISKLKVGQDITLKVSRNGLELELSATIMDLNALQ